MKLNDEMLELRVTRFIMSHVFTCWILSQWFKNYSIFRPAGKAAVEPRTSVQVI